MGVPADAVALVNRVCGSSAALEVRPSQNPSLAAAFPAGDVRLALCSGGCSCDLYTPTRRRGEAEQEERSRARYRRQGWSEAKIERALASRHAARQAQGRDAARVELLRAIEDWTRTLGAVRLVAHWYGGGFDEETVSIAARATLSLAQLAAAGGAFPEDTLVTVSLHAAGAPV